jgi:hypothetical protein
MFRLGLKWSIFCNLLRRIYWWASRRLKNAIILQNDLFCETFYRLSTSLSKKNKKIHSHYQSIKKYFQEK